MAGSVMEDRISQGSIQRKLSELGKELEIATHQLREAIREEAIADADYKAAFLGKWVTIEASAAEKQRLCEAFAVEEGRTKTMAEAQVKSLTEYTRSLRALIDLYRTLDADLREQT